jgi:4-amino-4-deoxy-L-arabinose transferase-like glycosyltransferase
MEGDLEHATEPAVGSGVETPLARSRPLWWWIRMVLTATAVVAFVLVALLDERPQIMLVGMAPLLLVAGEAVWRLFDETAPDDLRQ